MFFLLVSYFREFVSLVHFDWFFCGQKRNNHWFICFLHSYQELYHQVYPFISIFIVISIVIGVWSLQITSRMIAKHLPEHRILQKYFAIQLVLILYKLQPALINGFSYGMHMVAGYQINSKIIQNGKRQIIGIIQIRDNYIHINFIIMKSQCFFFLLIWNVYPLFILCPLQPFSYYSTNYPTGNGTLIIFR